MADGQLSNMVVSGRKATTAAFLDARLVTRAQNVVTQQRYESHGYDPRGNQRARQHHRQGVEELACGTPESQERQVSHDVGDGGVQNRRSQLGGTEPGSDARRMPGRQITL